MQANDPEDAKKQAKNKIQRDDPDGYVQPGNVRG